MLLRHNGIIEIVVMAKNQKRAARRWLNFLPVTLIFLLHAVFMQPWIFLSKRALASDMNKEPREKMTPPARDPKLAVEEEYQIAMRQGTVEALELFIARHPDDPLAEKARAALRQRSR
jgi:hypothetical protein